MGLVFIWAELIETRLSLWAGECHFNWDRCPLQATCLPGSSAIHPVKHTHFHKNTHRGLWWSHPGLLVFPACSTAGLSVSPARLCFIILAFVLCTYRWCMVWEASTSLMKRGSEKVPVDWRAVFWLLGVALQRSPKLASRAPTARLLLAHVHSAYPCICSSSTLRTIFRGGPAQFHGSLWLGSWFDVFWPPHHHPFPRPLSCSAPTLQYGSSTLPYAHINRYNREDFFFPMSSGSWHTNWSNNFVFLWN